MILVLLTATSVVAYSIMALLYKAAVPYVRAERMIWVATLVATVLGLVVWLASSEEAPLEGWVLGAVAGLTFYFASIARARAVQTSPVSLVFAITNLDLILAGAVTMAIPFFSNPPTLWKILACVVATAAVLLGSQVRGVEKLSPLTYLCLALLIVSAIASLTYARILPGALLFFLFIDHLAGLVPNLHLARGIQKAEWLWGLGVGVSMFIGFWTLLIAQARSPAQSLTLVLLALSMKTPLTAALSIPLFKEALTVPKLLALLLASLALILPQLGDLLAGFSVLLHY